MQNRRQLIFLYDLFGAIRIVPRLAQASIGDQSLWIRRPSRGHVRARAHRGTVPKRFGLVPPFAIVYFKQTPPLQSGNARVLVLKNPDLPTTKFHVRFVTILWPPLVVYVRGLLHLKKIDSVAGKTTAVFFDDRFSTVLRSRQR